MSSKLFSDLLKQRLAKGKTLPKWTLEINVDVNYVTEEHFKYTPDIYTYEQCINVYDSDETQFPDSSARQNYWQKIRCQKDLSEYVSYY